MSRIFRYANGCSYNGEWDGNKRHGHGTYTWPTGMYEGQFDQDRRHGKGKATFSDGTTYDGDWVYDKRTGQGEIVRGGGKGYFKGNFVDDKMEG